MFLANLSLIERLVRSTCRRHRFFGADAEDFESIVKLRFLEDDYAILRDWQQRSSLASYLYIVIERLFLDHRDHLWGRWRPSADAARLGDSAIALERAITRDGLSPDEAVESLVAATPQNEREGRRAELRALVLRLPSRPPRPLHAACDANRLASPVRSDASLLLRETLERSCEVSQVLADVVGSLHPTDRLILRLRFAEGLKIVTIAPIVGVEPKPLYRRIERLLRHLRDSLCASGLSTEGIRELLHEGCEEVEVRWEA